VADRSLSQQWCLVRWSEGYTSWSLERRGERVGAERRRATTCPETGASFGGPLSWLSDFRLITAGLGDLGFPGGYVGDVAIFDSEADAAAQAHHDGSHVALDVPTPIGLLRFTTRVYRHFDGSEEVLYEGADLRTAHAFRALGAEGHGKRVLAYVEVTPDWTRLGRHRPTLAQAQAMFGVAKRLRGDSDAPPPRKQQPRRPGRNWADVLEMNTVEKVTVAQIKKAYRRLARRHHPDRGGSHEAMLEINAACEAALREVSP
jgi:hypothetical protein